MSTNMPAGAAHATSLLWQASMTRFFGGFPDKKSTAWIVKRTVAGLTDWLSPSVHNQRSATSLLTQMLLALLLKQRGASELVHCLSVEHLPSPGKMFSDDIHAVPWQLDTLLCVQTWSTH